MEVVKLKNGSEEPEPLVRVTMFSFSTLLKEKPIVAFELVMKCRDANHQLFGMSGEDLKRLSLLQPNGQPHDSVRNIILSAAHGDGLDMTFDSPIA